MAQKKITELQLRSSVTDDLSIPSDDGIQSYRVTAAMIKAWIFTATGLGDLVYGGASGAPTRLAPGTANQYLKSNGAAAPSWSTFTPPTTQQFTIGSGTYTTPAGVKWIRVRMAGGGGGGGAPNSGTTAGGSGGTTTFGSSLLSCTGGGGSPSGPGSAGGSAGTSSVSAPAVGRAFPGQSGQGGGYLADANGGDGAGTCLFGGGGVGGARGLNGVAGLPNTGGGGGGGGGFSGLASAGGGGSAGSLEARIDSPSATYAYAVGVGGTAASTGGSGIAASPGAAGYIIVEEFYQ